MEFLPWLYRAADWLPIVIFFIVVILVLSVLEKRHRKLK